MRYTTRPNHHRTLGTVAEVYDTHFKVTASIYHGPGKDQRAEQRAEELNRADTEGKESQEDG